MDVGWKPQEFWGEIENWPLYVEGKGSLKKEAGHSGLIDGRFNKQENLLRRLILGGSKRNRSPHLPSRILNVYVEAKQFSHM